VAKLSRPVALEERSREVDHFHDRADNRFDVDHHYAQGSSVDWYILSIRFFGGVSVLGPWG
jgi:hypothetical protein